MEKSKLVQKALWANVVFAEIGAAAFLFLRGKLAFINELASGQPVLFGLELLMLAGLATYAALRPAMSRHLIRVIVGLNILLFGYFLETLLLGNVSAVAMEVLLIDMAVVAALTIAQVVGMRDGAQKKNEVLVS
ncbi:hypothetical protein GCM10028803_60730 [Larkinella knui]|uniref:DUF2127 domain-containing protein n=1 Tax=Larkinella knui TaxID=2025310 RepID=A0A3P1CAZ7_9BACT|nr:hypothetical protein [Larkinella knui]RRB10410.1 hypothetical protein EHT87_29755 [Larkinella knui]